MRQTNLDIQNAFFELQSNPNPENLSFVVSVVFFYVGYAFGLVFTVCELCQRISKSFLKINAIVDQLNWYLFPKNVQKMMLIISIMVQQSVDVECFGSIACNRDTFKRVSYQTPDCRYLEWPTTLPADHVIFLFRSSTKGIRVLCCFVTLANKGI